MGSDWKLLRRGMMKSEKCFQVINLEACEGKKKKPCCEWGSVLGLEFVGYILLLGLNKGWWNYHRASSEDSGQLNPSTVIHRQLPGETRSGLIMDGEYQGTMVLVQLSRYFVGKAKNCEKPRGWRQRKLMGQTNEDIRGKTRRRRKHRQVCTEEKFRPQNVNDTWKIKLVLKISLSSAFKALQIFLWFHLIL